MSIKLPSLKDNLIFWPIAAGGLAADLWTKNAVFNWLSERFPPVYDIIPGFFSLILAENAGAAFSLAQGRRTFLVAISIAALVMVFYIFFTSRLKHVLYKIALPMFVAGICGNLYDRLYNRGFVRDFIDVYYKNWHWPTFNIADSLLCAAVGLIILAGFLTVEAEKKSKGKV